MIKYNKNINNSVFHPLLLRKFVLIAENKVILSVYRLKKAFLVDQLETTSSNITIIKYYEDIINLLKKEVSFQKQDHFIKS